MATIRKRGEYSWEAQVRRQGFPTRTKTFNTRGDAEKWARALESELDRGLFIDRAQSEKKTFGHVCQLYQEKILPRLKGAAADASRLKRLREKFGKFSLAAITPSMVAEYRDERAKVVSPQTVKHELGLLTRVMKAAVLDFGIPLPHGLPTEKIRKPTVKNARERRLHPGELEAIEKASGSIHLPAVLRFAVETAMRRGEITGLHWENISLKKRVALLEETKNGDNRAVPLSSAAIEALESIPRRIDGKVFPVTGESLSQAFERALIRARKRYEEECNAQGRRQDPEFLVNLHLHDLRHEATSRLAEKLPVHELAKVTGHKDLRMLMRYYHPRAEDLAKKLG